MSADLDLSMPSYRGAVYLAQQEAFAGGSASKPNRAAGNAVLARLFWLVEASEGGFMGLPPDQVEYRARRYGLDMIKVWKAAWAPGPWPITHTTERKAA